MTFAEALKSARQLIESEDERFLCNALHRVGGQEYVPAIESHLEGCASYGDWLHLHRPELWRAHYGNYSRLRLAWIDDMIRREESK